MIKFRHVYSTLIAIALVALAVFLHIHAKAERDERVCAGLRVEMADSSIVGFVSEKDVAKVLSRQYGNFVGEKLGDLDLAKIEELVSCYDAVKDCQAYVSKDGMLHLRVTQRKPVVRFVPDVGRTFYADRTGVIFSSSRECRRNVPTVSGKLPISAVGGYKGRPQDETGRNWLGDIIDFLDCLRARKSLQDRVGRIVVAENGDLFMYTKKGNEYFVFGPPENCQSKLARMEDYYEYIEPTREDGYYGSVSVKFAGQIVCEPKNIAK